MSKCLNQVSQSRDSTHAFTRTIQKMHFKPPLTRPKHNSTEDLPHSIRNVCGRHWRRIRTANSSTQENRFCSWRRRRHDADVTCLSPAGARKKRRVHLHGPSLICVRLAHVHSMSVASESASGTMGSAIYHIAT